MKKVGLALLCLLLACGVNAMILFSVWNQFQPKAIIGSSIQTTKTDLKEITTEWFHDFFKQYEGITVPFAYRIKDKRIRSIEVLNKDGYVQLDYEYQPVSTNIYIGAYYNATLQENGWYLSQLVLKIDKTAHGYKISDKMSPVQYQIKVDHTLRDPHTIQYAMADEKETYVFHDSKLYVTYDKGTTLLEVPVPYKDIAGTNNALYNELLPAHGYIVTKAFTAFICYDDDGSYLLYSKDAGKNWNKSRILPTSYRGETLYLSKTENSCYITIATDRSLGHEYYSTYKSTDLKTWSYLDGEAFQEKKNVSFVSDGTAYIGAGTDQNQNPLVYYTNDDGKTYTTLTLPAYETEYVNNKIKPFILMEYAYRKKGKTYMVVGQGNDGDYMRNNIRYKGLYESDDGITFRFKKEIDDSPKLAG